MNFTPKSETEIAAEGLLPAGVYDFEVVTAEEKTSKSGNEMIAVDLKVFDSEGRTRFVKDWLLEAYLRKIMAFCKETGLRGAYDAGTLKASDLVGKCGKVELAVEAAGEYPAKNTVKTYGENGSKKAATAPAPATFKPTEAISQTVKELEEMDDIPF